MIKTVMLALGAMASFSFAITAPANAQQACSGVSRPIITLDMNEPAIEYDLRQSIRDLTMHQRSIAGYRSELGPTNGITRYRVSASYQAEMRVVGGATVCLAPTIIRLRAEIASPIVVAIASDYHRRSCAFEAIHQHELQHVQITQQTMRSVAHRIREQLANHMENRFYPGYSAQQAQQSFSTEMQRFINWAVGYAEQALREANGVIDTPESYRQLHMLCNDWLPNTPP